MHRCFNVVTERDGFPAAVLIRALEALEGVEEMRARGTARRSTDQRSGPPVQALDVDRRFDGADLCTPDALLFLAKDTAIPDEAIATGPRIGVRGDKIAVNVPWRLYVRDNRYISR